MNRPQIIAPQPEVARSSWKCHNRGPMDAVGCWGVEFYNTSGNVPYDVKIKKNAARTLEYAYKDFTIYQLSKEWSRSRIRSRDCAGGAF